MIKRILVGLGGTCFTPVAIQRAVELAKQNEAEVTAVTAIDLKRIMRVADDDQDTRHDQRQNRLGAIKQQVEKATSDFESACDVPPSNESKAGWIILAQGATDLKEVEMPRGTRYSAEQIIGKLREAEVELAQGKKVHSRSNTVAEVSGAQK